MMVPDANGAEPEKLPDGGTFVGTCSEFVRMFGCWRRIPRGTGAGPTELPPKICLD